LKAEDEDEDEDEDVNELEALGQMPSQSRK
jgi:hypothetical protein